MHIICHTKLASLQHKASVQDRPLRETAEGWFCFPRPIFKTFYAITRRPQWRRFILDGVFVNAWPIALLVKRLIYVTWSAIHSCLSQRRLSPLVLFNPFSSSSSGLGYWNPNDILDKWSISWQLQHLSSWQRWLLQSFLEQLFLPSDCVLGFFGGKGGNTEFVRMCVSVFFGGG